MVGGGWLAVLGNMVVGGWLVVGGWCTLEQIHDGGGWLAGGG